MVVRIFDIGDLVGFFTGKYVGGRRWRAKTYGMFEYAGFGMFFCEGGEGGVPF